MKTQYKIFATLFLSMLMFFNCEDNEKSPLPATKDGSFVTIEFDNLILDVSDLENSAIIGTLKAPVPNVARYDLEVRRTSNGVSTDYAPVYSTDVFPSEMVLTPGVIASALGLTNADLLAGDRFDFQAKSISTDGDETLWSTLNIDLQAEVGQLQSYQFTSFISCPFVRADIIGTWELIDGGFAGDVGYQFEIIESPDASNEVILINPFNSPEPNIPFRPRVVVDPFGIAELPTDTSVDPADTKGYPWFESSIGCCGDRFAPTQMRGDGFVFSCTGFMTFTKNVSAFVEINPPTGSVYGWSGDPNFVAQKVN